MDAGFGGHEEEAATEVIEVLIAEDDVDLAAAVQEGLSLSDAPAFDVTHVRRLSEALSVIEQRGFDVILLDLTLPDAQGTQAPLAIRAAAPDLPVVVLTGVDDEHIVEENARAGVQEYLLKGEVSHGLLVRTLRYAVERSRLLREMKAMVIRDDLTGLYNRRGFFTVGEQQLKIAERLRKSLLVLYVDLDNLKDCNDRNGHRTGDALIRCVARALSNTFRDSDVIGRLGGDEFAVLSLDVSPDRLETLLARLHKKLKAESLSEPLLPCPPSVSVGASMTVPPPGSWLGNLVREADSRMYAQKRAKKAAAVDSNPRLSVSGILALGKMPLPVPESYSEEERKRLSPYFTNLDHPIFGLKLPQEVAGALFSRYSRTSKSLRRVFLEEFAGTAPLGAASPADTPEALRRAREFYERVLVGYGDDSVAQLGGAHVACERVSNVAAKLLEDSRVGVAYLEKSTRYVRFDQKGSDGDWLFVKEPKLMASRFAAEYLALMERLFSTYARQLDPLLESIKTTLPIHDVPVRHPKSGEEIPWRDVTKDPDLLRSAERAYLATVRAHACDVLRSYLPGATMTNLGIFASGQAYEHLLNKLYSQELVEGQELARSIHRELRMLIPSFVKRAARNDYLASSGARPREAAGRLQSAPRQGSPAGVPAGVPAVTLVDYDAGAEERLIAALLYPHGARPLAELRELAGAMSSEERRALLEDVALRRRNRRDKPGRAAENVSYTFDLLANFGIYRDLQRHRLLTQERQLFTTEHGYDTPPELEAAGFAAEFRECMEQAAELHARVAGELPFEAQYLVPFAFRVRWYVRLNLREAVFLCELRSMPQGHPDYRAVVQEMWRQIEGVHPALSGWARFLNRDTYRLGRLASELKNEYKRELLTQG